LDPTSPANVTRVPARTEVWATHYNPPYSGPYNGPYNGPYAPPPGPPPAAREQDNGKPPGYIGSRRVLLGAA
ncbi:hypothetical protein MPER_08696, partial [Moniliophthora perniciosa FA553]